MEFTTNRLLHGGDYNPEQWLEYPDILEKDLELLVKAHCNVVSLGIFSWAKLEPEEGCFTFEWLEQIMDRLYARGISVILATPSGARPKWLADKYPEVLRVNADRSRNLFGGRHNHCYTSPVYREKVERIDRELARRLGHHPAVILWHISNEFGGECHCPLCQDAFRAWLKNRYGSVDELNRRWCTTFWSHTYQDFSQIESPSPRGEEALHALNLDWKRFVTERTCDFIRHEVNAIRSEDCRQPVTTNLMYRFPALDYFRLAKELDIVSWDTYPSWQKWELEWTASDNGMQHDLMRSLKKMPYLQMESCPSSTNWQSVSKLKRPGVLSAQSMQAIAHGSEGALYFQIRQSQGASEKFHGAVIDHYGGADTRVFGEVTRTGIQLEALSCLAGTRVHSDAAILFDWNNMWAMEDSQGPRNEGLHYYDAIMKQYRALRRQGLNVDFISLDEVMEAYCSSDGTKAEGLPYRLVLAPMCYMLPEHADEALKKYVSQGGTLAATYWTGIVDETDRCWLGGTPHGLMDVFGLRSMEIDGLYEWEENELVPVSGNVLGLDTAYTCKYLCDLVKAEEAQVLMTYGKDFYQGYPALTVHSFGEGSAWYIAADAEESFYQDFLGALVKRIGISSPVAGEIPCGLEVTTRETEAEQYVIFQNFGKTSVRLPLPDGEYEMLCGNSREELPVLGLAVLRKEKKITRKDPG